MAGEFAPLHVRCRETFRYAIRNRPSAHSPAPGTLRACLRTQPKQLGQRMSGEFSSSTGSVIDTMALSGIWCGTGLERHTLAHPYALV